MKTFESKNGPMLLNDDNASYVLETLGYLMSKELESFILSMRYEWLQKRFGSIYKNLDGSVNSELLGLWLRYNDITQINIEYDGIVFSGKGSEISGLLSPLDKDIAKYKRIQSGEYISYNDMNYTHTVKAFITKWRRIFCCPGVKSIGQVVEIITQSENNLNLLIVASELGNKLFTDVLEYYVRETLEVGK